MKVLFVLYHPVDPYIVVEAAKRIVKERGEVFFAIVEKEGIIEKIVNSFNFNYKVIGETKISLRGKIFNTVPIVYGIKKLIVKFCPDIVFSAASPYTSLSCRFSKTPLICWQDTETATFNFKFSNDRIDSLLIPDSFYKNLSAKNVVRFNGYKELAYLHPKYFKKDSSVLKDLGLKEDDKVVLLRFSALNAVHDIGLKSYAMTNDEKILNFIKNIENVYKVKVFISVTERDLDERFDPYKLRIDPAKYVHLLAHCSLYMGEGTTTAAEAGILGVPWIALRDKALGYLIDQEDNYGLGCRIEKIDDAFRKAEEYLRDENIKEKWKLKKDKLISDNIDVSSFLTWFLLNYPKSHRIMEQNPSYQNNFKNS